MPPAGSGASSRKRASLSPAVSNRRPRLARFRELAPEPAGGKLTVSLWLGQKPAVSRRGKRLGANVMAASDARILRTRPRPRGASFEFFPPKTAAVDETLWSSIRRLEPLRPKYVSVTYRAGGSTRERTHATVARILRETTLKPAAHLTASRRRKAKSTRSSATYWDLGVRHIVALRGDPPDGVGTRYEPTPGGYVNAADLTRGIKAIAPFEVSVACYPEKRPSPNIEADIDMLKAKSMPARRAR